MIKKRHLKLVISNSEKLFAKKKLTIWDMFQNIFFKTLKFLSNQTITNLDKKQYVQDYLTLKFADYQLSTGNSTLFPLYEAIKEVEKLEYNGKINSFYKRIAKNKL